MHLMIEFRLKSIIRIEINWYVKSERSITRFELVLMIHVVVSITDDII